MAKIGAARLPEKWRRCTKMATTAEDGHARGDGREERLTRERGTERL